jgi:predicted RNase H-like nuclease (RuvC/YqgF family)
MSELAVKLLTIANYYFTTRGVGHTTTMIEGAGNVDLKPFVLVDTDDWEPIKGAEMITIGRLYELQHEKRPLVIDNECLAGLLNEAAIALVKRGINHQHTRSLHVGATCDHDEVKEQLAKAKADIAALNQELEAASGQQKLELDRHTTALREKFEEADSNYRSWRGIAEMSQKDMKQLAAELETAESKLRSVRWDHDALKQRFETQRKTTQLALDKKTEDMKALNYLLVATLKKLKRASAKKRPAKKSKQSSPQRTTK